MVIAIFTTFLRHQRKTTELVKADTHPGQPQHSPKRDSRADQGANGDGVTLDLNHRIVS